MTISISCKELGVDCNCVSEGETAQIVMDSLIRHMNTEHTDDWFEIEEVYQIAHEVIRKKVA
jgi:predicted small metal-binding protein